MQSFIEKKSKMHAMNTKPTINNMRGFTLVELMVAVVLSAIAVVAIYRGYTSFSQSSDAQEQIIEMQQNLRIGMQWIEKDLRRAGMNEEEDDIVGFAEDGCFTNSITFSMDLTGGESDGLDNDHDEAIDGADTDPPPFNESVYGDGETDDPGEAIEYYLMYDDPGTGNLEICPAAFDADKYPCYLMREDTNAIDRDKIIDNVDALNFVYLDEDRELIAVPAGGVAPGDLEDIMIIQICLVVRTTNEDYRYFNTEPYENIRPLSGGGPETIFTGPRDNFRRRVFCKEIKVRNAGL
jgi:prepilin-type N-terminal cleavage/methylation domain-containing protein